MNTSAAVHGKLSLYIEKMQNQGLPRLVMDTFSYYYLKLASGEQGLIYDKDIVPIGGDEIPRLRDIKRYTAKGTGLLKNAVMIALNGGLGTSMGLEGPKSLLEARDGKTFLEIIIAQAQANGAKLALMNSFSTHQETVNEISRIKPPDKPLMFFQNRFPKVLRSDLTPAVWPVNPKLEWNPPGHGDIYLALYISGILALLLEKGVRYAFIANSDNLGAAMDPAILGYFADQDYPFMMEVAEKTPSDIKGGHLARNGRGRFLLRESAQCPDHEIAAFQDIRRYRFFNTNNIWINLDYLMKFIQQQGMIRLPMIVNPKHLDPRNNQSPQVFQIETAMGAAISLFEGAAAVNVPRHRFFPVKKCEELLIVRSDRFRLERGYHLTLDADNTSQIKVRLDPAYFGKIDDFTRRFKQGAPSLKQCETLTVIGDVFFGGNVVIKGRVAIKNTQPQPVTIPAGAVIDRDLEF